MVKTFGRLADNTIQIAKDDISDFHARITELPDDEFLVEDRGAVYPGRDTTNGTFINGYRVVKATVSINDEVRLSIDTYINLREVFDRQPEKVAEKADPLDFTIEFAKLKTIYDKYQKERLDVLQKHNIKTSVIRGLFTLLPLIFFRIAKYVWFSPAIPQHPTQDEVAALSDFSQNYIIFSVLGSTIGVMATGVMSPTQKLNDLDENFRVQYVCPNSECYAPLGSVSWANYYNQRKCFKCGAKYKG